MRKILPVSRIEIWSDSYINEVERRYTRDQDVDIIQIEHVEGKNFIVEIAPKIVDEEETEN